MNFKRGDVVQQGKQQGFSGRKHAKASDKDKQNKKYMDKRNEQDRNETTKKYRKKDLRNYVEYIE